MNISSLDHLNQLTSVLWPQGQYDTQSAASAAWAGTTGAATTQATARTPLATTTQDLTEVTLLTVQISLQQGGEAGGAQHAHRHGLGGAMRSMFDALAQVVGDPSQLTDEQKSRLDEIVKTFLEEMKQAVEAAKNGAADTAELDKSARAAFDKALAALKGLFPQASDATQPLDPYARIKDAFEKLLAALDERLAGQDKARKQADDATVQIAIAIYRQMQPAAGAATSTVDAAA